MKPGLWRLVGFTFLLNVSGPARALEPTQQNHLGAGSRVPAPEPLEETLKAEESLKKALLKQPTSPQLHYNLGYYLYRQKDFARARDEFETALGLIKNLSRQKSDPNFELMKRAWYNLGNTYFNLKDFAAAMAYYKSVINADPKHSEDARNNYAIAKIEAQKAKRLETQSSDLSSQEPALTSFTGVHADTLQVDSDSKRFQDTLEWLFSNTQLSAPQAPLPETEAEIETHPSVTTAPIPPTKEEIFKEQKIQHIKDSQKKRNSIKKAADKFFEASKYVDDDSKDFDDAANPQQDGHFSEASMAGKGFEIDPNGPLGTLGNYRNQHSTDTHEENKKGNDDAVEEVVYLDPPDAEELFKDRTFNKYDLRTGDWHVANDTFHPYKADAKKNGKKIQAYAAPAKIAHDSPYLLSCPFGYEIDPNSIRFDTKDVSSYRVLRNDQGDYALLATGSFHSPLKMTYTMAESVKDLRAPTEEERQRLAPMQDRLKTSIAVATANAKDQRTKAEDLQELIQHQGIYTRGNNKVSDYIQGKDPSSKDINKIQRLTKIFFQDKDLPDSIKGRGVDCDVWAEFYIHCARELGIPARLVTGHHNHPTEGTLHNANGHGWVEVYLADERKWMPIDATPPSSVRHPDNKKLFDGKHWLQMQPMKVELYNTELKIRDHYTSEQAQLKSLLEAFAKAAPSNENREKYSEILKKLQLHLDEEIFSPPSPSRFNKAGQEHLRAAEIEGKLGLLNEMANGGPLIDDELKIKNFIDSAHQELAKIYALPHFYELGFSAGYSEENELIRRGNTLFTRKKGSLDLVRLKDEIPPSATLNGFQSTPDGKHYLVTALMPDGQLLSFKDGQKNKLDKLPNNSGDFFRIDDRLMNDGKDAAVLVANTNLDIESAKLYSNGKFLVDGTRASVSTDPLKKHVLHAIHDAKKRETVVLIDGKIVEKHATLDDDYNAPRGPYPSPPSYYHFLGSDGQHIKLASIIVSATNNTYVYKRKYWVNGHEIQPPCPENLFYFNEQAHLFLCTTGGVEEQASSAYQVNNEGTLLTAALPPKPTVDQEYIDAQATPDGSGRRTIQLRKDKNLLNLVNSDDGSPIEIPPEDWDHLSYSMITKNKMALLNKDTNYLVDTDTAQAKAGPLLDENGNSIKPTEIEPISQLEPNLKTDFPYLFNNEQSRYYGLNGKTLFSKAQPLFDPPSFYSQKPSNDPTKNLELLNEKRFHRDRRYSSNLNFFLEKLTHVRRDSQRKRRRSQGSKFRSHLY